MRKFINKLFAVVLATAAITSCTVEEGTVPGNDKDPNVVVYKYTVKKPYNEDNDVALRLAFNNKVDAAYYLAEKTTEKEARVASLGEEGYMDYVVSNGTKIADVASDADLAITDLYGKYAITVVAVGGSKKAAAVTEFTGLEWSDVVTGTYYFKVCPSLLGMSTTSTTLQICTTDNTLYRLKDVFGKNSHMKIQLLPDYTATDSDGTYTYFRIPAVETPFKDGDTTLSARDIGYWQNNSAYVTDHGYESGMYEDYFCFFCIQYYAAKSKGYNYEYFVPDAE